MNDLSIVDNKNVGRLYIYFVSIFILAISITIQAIYINQAITDVIFADGADVYLYWSNCFLENCNLWSLFDIVNDHLTSGYKILTLANIYLFKGSSKFESFVFVLSSSIIYIGSVVYVVKGIGEFTKIGFAFVAILIGLASFSFSAPVGLFMVTQFSIGVAVFIVLAIYYSMSRLHGMIFYISFSALVVFYFGFLGSGYSISMFLSFIGVAIINGIKGNQLKKNFMVGLIVSVIFAIYAYYVVFHGVITIDPDAKIRPSWEFLLYRATTLFENIWFLVLSLFAGLGASLLAPHSLEGREYIYVVVGLFCFLFVFWCLLNNSVRIFRNFIMLMLFYTISVILVIRLGRGASQPWQHITNEWYFVHFRPFLLCIVFSCIEIIQRCILKKN